MKPQQTYAPYRGARRVAKTLDACEKWSESDHATFRAPIQGAEKWWGHVPGCLAAPFAITDGPVGAGWH